MTTNLASGTPNIPDFDERWNQYLQPQAASVAGQDLAGDAGLDLAIAKALREVVGAWQRGQTNTRETLTSLRHLADAYL